MFAIAFLEIYEPKYSIKSCNYNTEKIVLNILEIFSAEKENYGVSEYYFLADQKRVAKTLGICDRTLRNIVNRHKNEDHVDENVNFVVINQPNASQK